MTTVSTLPSGINVVAKDESAVPTIPIVSVNNLTKQFGDFTAVNGISFSVNHREIFGFLGPNGAGKSTTIKMICTLLQPTSGQIRVADHDVLRESSKVRSAIGIVFQDNSLDSGLTAQENLEFHCIMYHIPRAEREKRIHDVLLLMDLVEVKDRYVKTFSGGMRRRLEIARGLLHEPQLLILDEPTVGLDPQTRNYIWQYVRQLRERHDTTVFMTTHYMDEAEYCDRIAIIDRGEIIALDTPRGLKQMLREDRIEIVTSDPERARQLVIENLGAAATIDGNQLIISAPDSDHFVPRLLTELVQHNLRAESLQVRQTSLEDVFINLTGRHIREEEGGKDERRLTARRMGRM
ncbi:MAG: ATP-binding cassette domain-containing protein [Anaerolineae bacterium]|nr:ATP-binding cassette domain-containing protein [Anaerolineae bacterium]